MVSTALLVPHITNEALFYGFILGYHINIRWSTKPSGPVLNDKMRDVLKSYLQFTCGNDEWKKRKVLDVIKESRTDIRRRVKQVFPSLFHRVKQKDLQVPEELKDVKINFDINIFNELKDKVSEIKKSFILESFENNYNDNVVDDKENNMIDPQQKPAPESGQQLETELVINGITIRTPDDYKRATGKRYRVTKEQKALIENGTITREMAFKQFTTQLMGV